MNTPARRPVTPARQSRPLPTLRALATPLVLLAAEACTTSHAAASQDLVREPEAAATPALGAPTPAPAAAPAPAPAPVALATSAVTVAQVDNAQPPASALRTKRRPPSRPRWHVYAGRMAITQP